MLFSRFFTLSEYGTYAEILLIVSLASSAFAAGSSGVAGLVSPGGGPVFAAAGGIVFYLRDPVQRESRRQVLSAYAMLTAAMGFLAGLALVIAAPAIADFFDDPMIERSLFLFAVLPWAWIVMSSFDSILAACRGTSRAFLFRVLNGAVSLAVLLLAGLAGLRLEQLLPVYFGTEVLFAIAGLLLLKKAAGGLRFRRTEAALALKILKLSFPAGAAAFVSLLGLELGKIFTARYFAASDVGIYANASAELPVTAAAVLIAAILVPQLSALLQKGDPKSAAALYRSAVTLCFAVLGFFASVFCVLAPETITLLYTDKFLPGAGAFRVFALILPFRPAFAGLIPALKGKVRFLILISLLSLALNGILCHVFYNLFGRTGPALAAAAAIGLVRILQLACAARSLDVRISTLFPWGPVLTIALQNAALAAAFILLRDRLPLDESVGKPAGTLLLAVAWTVLYAILMAGVLRREWNTMGEYCRAERAADS